MLEARARVKVKVNKPTSSRPAPKVRGKGQAASNAARRTTTPLNVQSPEWNHRRDRASHAARLVTKLQAVRTRSSLSIISVRRHRMFSCCRYSQRKNLQYPIATGCPCRTKERIHPLRRRPDPSAGLETLPTVCATTQLREIHGRR